MGSRQEPRVRTRFWEAGFCGREKAWVRQDREEQFLHAEHRNKVTLQDYRYAKWLVFHGLEHHWNNRRWFNFMSSPLDAPRLSARDQLARLSAKPTMLANKAKHFLTLASEYAERERYAKARAEIEPPYPQRLRLVCPAKPTCQAKPKPFEAGRNVLPGMEAFAKQLSA